MARCFEVLLRCCSCVCVYQFDAKLPALSLLRVREGMNGHLGHGIDWPKVCIGRRCCKLFARSKFYVSC